MSVGWRGIATVVLGFLSGVLMLVRPALFFGPDEYDAHDPRTVRFFGGVLVTLTGAAIAFLLYGWSTA